MRICRALCLVVCLCIPNAVVSAQLFEVFNLDASAHPTMRAKVIYAPNGVQSRPITASDIRITDVGVTVPVTSVTCEVVSPEALHICIILDFKNYSPLVRYGLRRLIEQLPMPEADVAILSTYEHVQVIQDYTRDRGKALAAVDAVTESPGLDLQRAFYSLPNGAIPFSEGRTGKTMIIFVSDLHCPKFNLDEARLYADAKKHRMSVNSILLGTSDITGLFKRIAINTTGVVHEHVKSEEGFDLAINRMWSVAYGSCSIEWQSPPLCDAMHTVVFDHLTSGQAHSFTYFAPRENLASWTISPRLIRLVYKPGVELDTVVELKARFKRASIVAITTNPPEVTAVPTSMTVDTTQITRLHVRWLRTPGSQHGQVNIMTDCGELTLHLYQPDSGKIFDPIQLRVPNGGEEYIGGTSAVLTYDGVADEDIVHAQMSTDAGATWTKIGSGKGGSIPWAVPPTQSNSCLARIESKPTTPISIVDSITHSARTSRFLDWFIDPRERWLIVAIDDSTSVYDFDTFDFLMTLPTKGVADPGSIASPDNGDYVAVAVDSGVVILYDAQTWVERRRLKVTNDDQTPAISVSPSGEYILVRGFKTGYDRRGLTLFDSAGVVIYDTDMRQEDLRGSAHLHPNGEYIAWSSVSVAYLMVSSRQYSHHLQCHGPRSGFNSRSWLKWCVFLP